jgi:hypothetical protein
MSRMSVLVPSDKERQKNEHKTSVYEGAGVVAV